MKRIEPIAPKAKSQSEAALPAGPPAVDIVSRPLEAGEGKVKGSQTGASAGTGAASAPRGPMTARIGAPNGPRVKKMTQPKYPPRARRLRREGKVLLQLHIDRYGAVRAAEVIESAGSGFDESALEAVKSSRFIPATRNGRPVDCLALLPVQFVLDPQR